MNIKVIKRNGTIEIFKPSKITNVLVAAGLNKDRAEKITAKVARWVVGRKEKTIISLQIRTKVIEELKKVDFEAANLFGWYQNRKDIDHGAAIKFKKKNIESVK